MPTLSEHESKTILAAYGVPIAAERLATDADAAVGAATALGFPVVVKLCAPASPTRRSETSSAWALSDAAPSSAPGARAPCAPPP
jgi:hypothetical protein